MNLRIHITLPDYHKPINISFIKLQTYIYMYKITIYM